MIWIHAGFAYPVYTLDTYYNDWLCNKSHDYGYNSAKDISTAPSTALANITKNIFASNHKMHLGVIKQMATWVKGEE